MQQSAPWTVPAQVFTPSLDREVRDSRLRLGAALAAGALTHALFRHAALGLNLALWSLGAAAASLWLFRGRRIGVRGWAATGSLVALGLAPVWHASDWALGWALPSWFVLLLLAPALVRDDVSFADVVGRPLRAVLHVPASMAAAARMRGLRLPPSAVGKAVVGVLLGAPFTVVFLLLLSFDDDFVHALQRTYERLGTGVSIVLCTLVWTVTIGIAVGAHKRALLDPLRPPPPRWEPPPYRLETDMTLPSALAGAPPANAHGVRPAPWLSPLTWTLAVGQVVVVLGGYVAVSARHGFGGHAAVREAGETYAGYLHAGVLQLLIVAALSVGLVLGGHALVGAHRARVATALECALLGLSGATLGSCFLRIHVYEQAYGATLQRMGVGVVAVAVAVVLALTILKSLRPSWSAYWSTAVLSVVFVCGAASFFDADRSVARTNLDRASEGHALDDRYLASLSSDACAEEGHPYLQSHPPSRASIAGGWAFAAQSEHASWRSLRGLRSCSTAPRGPASFDDERQNGGEADADSRPQ